MKDRIKQYPHRYKLTPVSGTSDTYDFQEITGTVTEQGTPINKATMLDDITASLLGLSDTDATVNNAIKKITEYVMPIGGIIMWSGAIVDIPNGWALCDGTNGTPNLENRFIVGAGDIYSVGDVGGDDTSTVPAHSHTYSGTTSSASGGSLKADTLNYTVSTPSHTHTYSGTTATLPLVTLDNRPPYYALAYIIKVAF